MGQVAAFLLAIVFLVPQRPTKAQNDVVLRYSESACDSLIPTPTEENYAAFNLGSEIGLNGNKDTDSVFDSPKEITSRNPPFDIELDFSRYRAGKEYEIKIVAEQSYDSFILQIRGRRDETGNVTYPGKWIKIPHIAHQIDCGRKRGVAVIDKGLPIRLSNLTFLWKAPDENVGSIRAVASVAYDNVYQNLISREIRHESFPIPVSNCGKTLGCFRHCKSEPKCDPDDTELVVTMGLDERSDPDQPEIEFKLGGKLSSNKSDFVALGLGHSYHYLKSLDIVTCVRDGIEMELGHYFLEDDQSEPYKHRSEIRLLNSGIDDETGLSWCSFTRPIRPETPLDLDLTKNLYHFYFKGDFKDSSLIMPKATLVQKSGFKFNITEPFVDIRYSSASSSSMSFVLLLVIPVFAI